MSDAARVEALFFAALEKEAAAERAAYLDAACGGDAGLRRQVERLLKAHPAVGDFLQTPAPQQLARAPEPPDATQEFDAASAGQREGGTLDFLQPSTRPDSLGRLAHYEVLQVLGRGGFGTVLKAFDEQLRRWVAIKVPHSRLVPRPRDAEPYLAEARAAASLDHPNIVPVFDVGSSAACPCFIVSKFVEGRTLAWRLEHDRPSPQEAAVLVAALAEALHYAHRRGLVHRDVKPDNVLLDAGGKPFVVDFGLALREEDVGQGPRLA